MERSEAIIQRPGRSGTQPFQWNFLYDGIFLINLPHRNDRLNASITELNRYKIPFTVWPASSHENGQIGIRLTLTKLFQAALMDGMTYILVFEDDVKFVNDPNAHMHECHKQLHSVRNWDIFYLGPNTHKPFGNLVMPNLLKVEDAYGLHAVAYSAAGMAKCLDAFEKMPDEPIDVCMAALVQTQGLCYCSYPILATQSNSYSDIEKREVNQGYIETRFYQHTKHLR